jgi:hypothetical protein
LGCVNNRCANCNAPQCGPGNNQRRDCVFGQLQNPVSCDNFDPCDGAEGCSAGFCVPAPQPLNCNDTDPCTDDSCSFGNGCRNAPIDSNVTGQGECCILPHCDPPGGPEGWYDCVDGRQQFGLFCGEFEGFVCVNDSRMCAEQ